MQLAGIQQLQCSMSDGCLIGRSMHAGLHSLVLLCQKVAGSNFQKRCGSLKHALHEAQHAERGQVKLWGGR